VPICVLHANLDGAIFDGADLTASLIHTEDLHSDAFSNVKVSKSLENLEYSIKAIIAEHRVWVNTLGREGKRADLIGLDLSGVALDGIQLQAASLQKALLSRSSFDGATFTMSDMSYCNAREASFVKADFRGVNFSMSRLDEADLQYADFSPMLISRTLEPTFWPSSLAGASLQNTRLRGANLKGANMERTQLVGADLRDTDLEGTIFIDANLTGADLRGAKMEKADFRGAIGVK